MADVFCSKLQEDGIKAVLPYVIVGSVIILAVSAALLFVPVILLIRKIIRDLGLAPFRCPRIPEPKTDEDEPLLPCDDFEKQNQQEFAKETETQQGFVEETGPQREFPKAIEHHQAFVKVTTPVCEHTVTKHPAEKRAGVPFKPRPLVDQSECEIQINVANKKMVIHSRNEIVETINVLINSNNIYFTVIYFLIMTILIHLCVILVEAYIRIFDYQHMWEAIQAAKKSVNATSAPLNILQEMVKTP